MVGLLGGSWFSSIHTVSVEPGLVEFGYDWFVCCFSLAGCPQAMLSNILLAMKAALRHKALGVVICDWAGKGHLTQPLFSWPGFLVGSGLAWNTNCLWVRSSYVKSLHFFLHSIKKWC